MGERTEHHVTVSPLRHRQSVYYTSKVSRLLTDRKTVCTVQKAKPMLILLSLLYIRCFYSANWHVGFELWIFLFLKDTLVLCNSITYDWELSDLKVLELDYMNIKILCLSYFYSYRPNLARSDLSLQIKLWDWVLISRDKSALIIDSYNCFFFLSSANCVYRMHLVLLHCISYKFSVPIWSEQVILQVNN